jgi:rubrerythrin
MTDAVHDDADRAPPPVQSPSPIRGWRCDLCGEIVTDKERRPLTPPECCPRCSFVRLTPTAAWASRLPVGLWTH